MHVFMKAAFHDKEERCILCTGFSRRVGRGMFRRQLTVIYAFMEIGYFGGQEQFVKKQRREAPVGTKC